MSATWKKNAREQQELYHSLLGGRYYDYIEYSDRLILEDKLSYVLFGPLPKNGYSSDQNTKVREFSDKIINNAKRVGHKGIHFSAIFIIGIIEDTNQEFVDVVFRIESTIFIDSIGRVYDSWNDFWSHNKFPKCWYCYPGNGFYHLDGKEVSLGFDTSPACDLLNRTGDVLDTASMVTTVGAGVVGIIGLFTPLAPLVLIGAGIAGGTGGAYTATRAGYTLYDRASHDQSISLGEAEARSAWLDVVMGPLSVAVGIKSVVEAVKLTKIAKAGKAAADIATAAKSVNAANAATRGGEILKSAAISAEEAASFAGNVAKGAKDTGKVMQVVTSGNQLIANGMSGTLMEVPKALQSISGAEKTITLTLKSAATALDTVDDVARVAKIAKITQIMKKGIDMGILVTQKSYQIAELATCFVLTQIPRIELSILDKILSTSKSVDKNSEFEIEGIRQSLLFFFHILIEKGDAHKIFEEVASELQEIMGLVKTAFLQGKEKSFEINNEQKKSLEINTLHLRIIKTGQDLLNILVPWMQECACNYKKKNSAQQAEEKKKKEEKKEENRNETSVNSKTNENSEYADQSDEEPEKQELTTGNAFDEPTIYELELHRILDEIRNLRHNETSTYINYIQEFASNLASLARVRNIRVRINDITRSLEISIQNRPTITLETRIRDYLTSREIIENYGHDVTESCDRNEMDNPAIYTILCNHCNATYTGRSRVSASDRENSHRWRFNHSNHPNLVEHTRQRHQQNDGNFNAHYTMHIMHFFDVCNLNNSEIRPVEVFFQWLLRSRKEDGGSSKR